MRHIVILSLAVCLLATGCTSKRINEPPITFSFDGPAIVDAELFAGEVRITSAPSMTEPRIVIQRESLHGSGRQKEGLASLEEISWTVDLKTVELERVIEIRAETTNAEPHFQRVNVTLELPQVSGVKVRTRNGQVQMRNVSGTIDVSTTDGNVLLATMLPLTEPVMLVTSRGDIDLRMRGQSEGELDLHTQNGEVKHRNTDGRAIFHAGTRLRTLLAQLNGGDNPIVARTTEGDIRLAVVENPMEFGQFIVEP